MTLTELKGWLQQQSGSLDNVIADAAKEFYEHSKVLPSYGFDLAECQKEAYHLINGEDLCYDRLNTPLLYSLWYHGRRVNTFLSHFCEYILRSTEEHIDIFDLGAGTGAVQWAIGLIYHRMKELNRKVPAIRILNIDTSPFMLYYSRDYLWKHFVKAYPHAADLVIDYEINSWSNSTSRRISNPWIVASYLFDVSDTYSNTIHTDYRASVKSGFKKLLDTFDPSLLFLLTSTQPHKERLMQELRNDFFRSGYNYFPVTDTSQLLRGDLPSTSAFRHQLFTLYESEMKRLPGKVAASLNRNTYWSEGHFSASILTKQQTGLKLDANDGEKQEIRLFNESIRIRKDVALSEDQVRASAHSDRPTVILGPAGCGKSVVLTERIRNLVRDRGFDTNLHILVTTFNKDLLINLGDWIFDLLHTLDPSKVSRVGAFFYFQGNSIPNITLRHLDILPTKLGIKLSEMGVGLKTYHEPLVAACIEEIKRERNITTNIYDGVLNVQYVLDEYQRVIFGLQISTREAYLVAERKGRPRLQISGPRRELLWEVIVNKYLKQMKEESFTSKRHRFLQQLNRNEIDIKFTHIFLDEFQDCTEADYAILYKLLEDPNNLVIAGDVAQSIQLGSVADVPRLEGEIMQRRVFHRLKGSYRLPFRISECIGRISETIENGNVVSPFKSSPPGARPIVVFGNDETEIALKIKDIVKLYGYYRLDSVSVLEPDVELTRALWGIGIENSYNKILKIKGMERSCVLWSTRMDIEYKYEVEEYVHTTLTRTNSILIIALFPSTLPKYYKILCLLRVDRLIFWDAASESQYHQFCNTDFDAGEVEDD